MDFWTKEEYLKFSEAMMDKPRSYYAFEMLYWCGMRSGDAYGKIRLKLEQIQ
jgi:integrase